MRLNQLFLAEFGVTTLKYWDRRRLEMARQCLETSRLAMKEIACLLGFRSDSHFVVWFRRHAGQRPETTEKPLPKNLATLRPDLGWRLPRADFKPVLALLQIKCLRAHRTHFGALQG